MTRPRKAEVAYATKAMVAAYGCWKPDEVHVAVEAVIDNRYRNATLVRRVILDVVPSIFAE